MALTALDFPASPTVGQVYPDPPVTGQPQYAWNGSQWLSSKAAVTQIARTDALGWSGMQINGSMEVSQEKGHGVTATTTNGGFICDGWRLGKDGTSAVSAVASISPIASGLSCQINIQVSTAVASLAANDLVSIFQSVEGYRISRLAWGTANAKPITIGFWTAHHRTGLYTGVIRNGANNRSYGFTYTQNAVDIPQYNTITIPGDTSGTWTADNTTGLQIVFTMASGTTYTAPAANTWGTGGHYGAPGQINGIAATSDVFRLTGVVVLPGIEAPTAAQSPLIMRPYDQELVACQRYFRSYGGNDPYETIGNGQCANATTAVISISFGPEMRARPTLPTPAFSFALHTAGTGIAPVTGYTLSTVSRTNATINCGVASGLVAGNATKLITNNDLNARLRLDARL